MIARPLAVVGIETTLYNLYNPRYTISDQVSKSFHVSAGKHFLESNRMHCLIFSNCSLSLKSARFQSHTHSHTNLFHVECSLNDANFGKISESTKGIGVHRMSVIMGSGSRSSDNKFNTNSLIPSGMVPIPLTAPAVTIIAVFLKIAAFLFYRIKSMQEKIKLNFQNLPLNLQSLYISDEECAKELSDLNRLKTHRQGFFAFPLALLSTGVSSSSLVFRDHFASAINELRNNPTFMSALLAWSMAQILKVFTKYAVERKWDIKMLMGSGGMPSSHSALCIALTTSIALTYGFSNPLFPVCLGFSLIVMYDATGVRYHAGMQAEVLNVIVADMFQGHPVSEIKLKELLGHTPLQVFAGAVLGTIVPFLYFQRIKVP